MYLGITAIIGRSRSLSLFRRRRLHRTTPIGLLLAISASAHLTVTTTVAANETPSTEMSTSALVSTTQHTFTHIVEWDIPITGDVEPGAIAVDSHGKDKNRVWFLTRSGPQKVYRFDPAKSLMKGSAQWMSWQLSLTSPPFSTGGLKRLKPSDDRRYVFVRTSSDLQRVDTQNCKVGSLTTCQLTIWQDKEMDEFSTSDLAVDSMNRVFTTALSQFGVPDTAYVQMLTPGPDLDVGDTTIVKVKRWPVRGGAGFCQLATSGAPCLSGIDVYHSKYQNLVYYSEPAGNNIGELNIVTNVVRRWSLDTLGAFEPRQLNIDRHGKVWVVTGSRHLVSLDPNTNKMTRHLVPPPLAEFGDSDLFGVAPDDDVIGYTDAGFTENKVAMLFPKGYAFHVTPACETLCPIYADVPVTSELSIADSASVPPQGKIAPVTITPNSDGTFVEARVDLAECASSWCSPVNSLSPRGITPNRGKAQGTFFYTVGFSDAVRIGFARLPHKDKIKHGRDDDDCDDGEDRDKHPGWHDHHTHGDDEDGDGVDSKHDYRTSREDSESHDSTALGAGQVAEYPLTASPTSLALIASVISDNPLAQIGLEVYSQLGVPVGSGVSLAGVAVATVTMPAAGVYKVRVKNHGAGSVNHRLTLLVREPWLP
jgi:hypothetical protein